MADVTENERLAYDREIARLELGRDALTRDLRRRQDDLQAALDRATAAEATLALREAMARYDGAIGIIELARQWALAVKRDQWWGDYAGNQLLAALDSWEPQRPEGDHRGGDDG